MDRNYSHNGIKFSLTHLKQEEIRDISKMFEITLVNSHTYPDQAYDARPIHEFSFDVHVFGITVTS